MAQSSVEKSGERDAVFGSYRLIIVVLSGSRGFFLRTSDLQTVLCSDSLDSFQRGDQGTGIKLFSSSLAAAFFFSISS